MTYACTASAATSFSLWQRDAVPALPRNSGSPTDGSRRFVADLPSAFLFALLAVGYVPVLLAVGALGLGFRAFLAVSRRGAALRRRVRYSIARDLVRHHRNTALIGSI